MLRLASEADRQVRRDFAASFQSNDFVPLLTRAFNLLLCVTLLLSASPVPVRAAFSSDTAFSQAETPAPASRERAFLFRKKATGNPPAVVAAPAIGHRSGRILTDNLSRVPNSYERAAGSTPNINISTGEQLDGARGLYYLRARLMNPLTGRFWSADSYEGAKRDPATLHRYLYANADPVSGIDPSGCFSLPEINISTAINATLKALPVQAFRFAYARAFNAATALAFSRVFQGAVVGAFSANEAYHQTGSVETAFLAAALGYVFEGGPVLPRSWQSSNLRQQVVQEIEEAVNTTSIYKLDPAAVVGVRGSVATGVKYDTKGSWNPNDFDIDAFIVSDKIASTFPSNLRFRDARFAGSAYSEELGKAAEEAQVQFLLNNAIPPGLRTDRPFTFRVFTWSEWAIQQAKGEQQIILK